jgi:hypothetical protein
MPLIYAQAAILLIPSRPLLTAITSHSNHQAHHRTPSTPPHQQIHRFPDRLYD